MIKVEIISKENFFEFGSFENFLDPNTNQIGEEPIEFYPDILQMSISDGLTSMSMVRVQPRPFVIDDAEYHSFAYEAILPLDGDVLIFVGSPTKGKIPDSGFRVFKIACGTMAIIKPGVWHGAPYAMGKREVRSLIVLPERTYANDCVFAELEKPEKIEYE